jgi:Tol biopolymer transport system component
VYTAEDSRGVNLKLLNVSTGASTPLTDGNRLNLDPVWSPDGRRIAFVRTEPRTFHIYVMEIADGVPGSLTRLTEGNDFGRPRLDFRSRDDHIQPSWSPTGRELLVVSNRGIALGSGAIWRMPMIRDAMSEARIILDEETLYRTRPQWSPDGKRILYSSHRGGQFNHLYVLPASGGEPYPLTFGDWDHFDARWSPDGEWIAYISNRDGASELRLLQTFGGDDRPVEIRKRIWRRPVGTLEVNLPAPARVYLAASDGKTYAPADSYQRVSRRSERGDFFYAHNSFRLELPAGKVNIEAVRGIEFRPDAHTVEVRPGQAAAVTLAPQGAFDMRKQGWWSGSGHVHMNYGGNLRNTPENVLRIARAEGLDVIAAKVANKDTRVFDYQHFTGEIHAQSTSRRVLRFDEEYRPPFYGHINLINLARHLISPLATGYQGTAIESLYPSNTDMIRRAQAEGGLAGYAHPWARDPEISGYGGARAFPVDLALGTTRYLEVLTSARHFTHTARVWHRALNCGFRITASGGEDSMLDLNAAPIPGTGRVYARLDEQLTWSGWVDAIRRGRTFVTNGPLLRFRVNGAEPGDEIRLPESGGTLKIEAGYESLTPVNKLELFLNGESMDVQKSVRVERSGWLTFRASGPASHPIDDEYVVAETSPIYISCGDRPVRSRPDAEYFIRWVDDVARQVKEHEGWRSRQEQQHVLAQFAKARQFFEERARED